MAKCSCTRAALGNSRQCNISVCDIGALSAHGLAVRRWPNGAFGGNYDRTVVPMLKREAALWPADEVFSVEILGMLTLPAERAENERWRIECDSQGGSFYLWLDDHLVCEGGNGQPRWNPYRL